MKKKLLSLTLLFAMIINIFPFGMIEHVYAAGETQITKINVRTTAGTTNAEYGTTITQPTFEIVSTEPAGAKDYLNIRTTSGWYKGDTQLNNGETFGEGKYSLRVSVGLSTEGQGLYKFYGPIYLNETKMNGNSLAPSYVSNRLDYIIDSPSGTSPNITTSTLNSANNGDVYSYTLDATGSKPISWTLKSDSSLPSGLNLSTDGIISGTPTVSGNYSFIVIASNSAGSDEQELSLNITNISKIIKINVRTTAGTTTAEYGKTITQPTFEIVSTEPAGAKDYLNIRTTSGWYKGDTQLNNGETFGEGKYSLRVSVGLSTEGQGLYKFYGPIYLNETKMNGNSLAPSYVSNRLDYDVSTTTQHEVKFMSEGSLWKTENVNDGATIPSTIGNPSRAGHSFNGWYMDDTCNQPFDLNTTITSGITLYAGWDAIKYTINYNANGGTGAPSSQEKTHGTDLTLSSTIPTRDGYEFLGWATTNNATTPIYLAGADYTANEGTTLYAVWRENAPIDINTLSATITLPVAGEHPTFSAIPGDTSKYTIEGNVLFTEQATWTSLESSDMFEEGKTYDIAILFKPNSGYNIPNLANVKINGIDANYVSSITDGSGTKVFNIIYTVPTNAPTTYTVTFNTDGGTPVPAVQNVTSGEKATKPATDPTKTGYIFDGWYVDASFTTEFNFNTETITANRTVYAKFTENAPTTYTITVESGTARVEGTEKYSAEAGETVVLNSSGAPTGKEFDKWELTGVTVSDLTQGEITFTMPANNVVARATYKDIVDTYDFIDNTDDQTFTVGNVDNYVIKIKASVKKFVSLKVDGVEYRENTDYEVTSGSTIITFLPAGITKLNNLAVGEYDVEIEFTDENLIAKLNLTEDNTSTGGNNNNQGNTENNNTTGNENNNEGTTTPDDNNNNNNNNESNNVNNPKTFDGGIVMYIVIAILSILGLSGAVIMKKKGTRA